MQKMMFLVFAALFLGAFTAPCTAEEKKITVEVLQVMDADVYDQAFQGFLRELEGYGFVQGANLMVNRKVIPYDSERDGMWDKLKAWRSISSEASRIVKAKPDLALTIGSQATKGAKDDIVEAGIPLVFTAVAVPETAGCKSLTEAGPGFTGATTYVDMTSVFKITTLAFPKARTVGIIHSDDEIGMAQALEAQEKAKRFGITIIARQVKKSQPVRPAAEELLNQGADMLIVPLDAYYGLTGNESAKGLAEVCAAKKVPVISLAMNRFPGACLSIGTDFPTVGSLAGRQAARILKKTTFVDRMPIARMEQPRIIVDTAAVKALGIELPPQILQVAAEVK